MRSMMRWLGLALQENGKPAHVKLGCLRRGHFSLRRHILRRTCAKGIERLKSDVARRTRDALREGMALDVVGQRTGCSHAMRWT